MRFHDERNKMTKQEYLRSEDVFFIGFYDSYPLYKYERQADCGCRPIYEFYLDKGDEDDLEVVEGEDLLTVMELYDPWLYKIEKKDFFDKNWIIKKMDSIYDTIRICLKHRINKPYTYREICIAVMMKKKYTIGEVKGYLAENRLSFDLVDVIMEICFKTGIRYKELLWFRKNDDSYLNIIGEDLDGKEFIDKVKSKCFIFVHEVNNCVVYGKCFINEIKALAEGSKLPDDAPIIDLFDEQTRDSVELCLKDNPLIESNSHYGIITIERQDKSRFKHKCEIAITDEEIKQGFGDRMKTFEDSAMWYLFEEEKLNITVPEMNMESSTAFVRKDGSICEIVTCKANQKENFVCKEEIKYMLQVPLNWFKENNVQVGDKIFTKKCVNFCVDY